MQRKALFEKLSTKHTEISPGQVWMARRPWGDDEIAIIIGVPFKVEEEYLVETYTLFSEGRLHQCRIMVKNLVERLDGE